MEVNGHFRAPANVPEGKNPRYPVGGWLDGLQKRSGRFAEEKVYLSVPENDQRFLKRLA
jgi:hypothetical protein